MGNMAAHNDGVIPFPRTGGTWDVGFDPWDLYDFMLTEVEIMQTRAPVERQTGLVSCSRHLTYIMYGGKEHVRYEKNTGENKSLGSACAGAPL